MEQRRRPAGSRITTARPTKRRRQNSPTWPLPSARCWPRSRSIPPGGSSAAQNNQPHFNPGIGDLTVPFPPADKQPIKPGVTWSIPDELKLPLDDGTIKKVQTQQQYKLEKVEAGVATIAVATQVLTPINDPKLQSQLVQRLQSGTIKFDIDAGRLLHKQLDIDQASLRLQRRRQPHAISGPLHRRAAEG